MNSYPSNGSAPGQERPGGRDIPPPSTPRIGALTVVEVLVWLVGIVVAVAVPMMVTHLGSSTSQASVGAARLWESLAGTAVGIALCVLACIGLYRTHREAGVVVMAIAPTSALLIGGLAIVAAKAPY